MRMSDFDTCTCGGFCLSMTDKSDITHLPGCPACWRGTELDSMCMTWRHDFGLMDDSEKGKLRELLSGLHRHHVVPLVKKLAEATSTLSRVQAENAGLTSQCEALRAALGRCDQIASSLLTATMRPGNCAWESVTEIQYEAQKALTIAKEK